MGDRVAEGVPGATLAAQRRRRRRRRLGERFGVLQAGQSLGEVCLFVGLRSRRVDLVELVAEPVELTGPFPLGGLERC
jgi:hypothetical protein